MKFISSMLLKPKLNSFIFETFLTEFNVFYYSIIGWFKQPNVNDSEKTYSYHKTSQLKTFVIVFSIIILLEGILFHYLIQLWSDVAAWVFTALNIYALLYIIGLYNSAKLLPHRLFLDHLIIHFGFQSSIKLNLSDIDCIKAVEEKGDIWGDKPKDKYHSVLNVDSPQYEIFLKEPSLMKSSYGKKKYVKSVLFRADNPTKMLEKINNNIKCTSNEAETREF
ncbi:hypothetical protein CEY16_11330 [Halalkalibacillus sediminis]|uniref:Uncharacterized protein n=1 Tax=Halalkalibacillus sediminis TaxID=2018042 RepID=A0A2I0QSN7_9BACI|nr:hypothetical protein [Halalkalibacillus sediminis]PKR77318.1 hypothetical protein CEY16_11330 [Halalkalibacillus sediminis]